MMQTSIMAAVFILYVTATTCFEVNAQTPWDMHNMKIYCNAYLENRTISVEGCRKENVLVMSCLGLCRSYAVVLPSHPYFASKCQCCKHTGVVTRFLTLKDCNPGMERTVRVESAVGCSCQTTKCEVG